MQAQADKLKLQEELEAAKRALESSGNEKQALQGTLDLAQQDKLTLLQGELKVADGLLESSRKENTELQGKPYAGKLDQFVEVWDKPSPN